MVEGIVAIDGGCRVRIDRDAQGLVSTRGRREDPSNLRERVLWIVQEGAHPRHDSIGEARVLLEIQPSIEPALFAPDPVAVVIHWDAEVDVTLGKPFTPVPKD